jgi:hypothetical protein
MKFSMFLIFPLIVLIYSYQQKVQIIKFIFRGKESKPRGTLLISIGKDILPTDKGEAEIGFGKGVKTDDKTFIFLKEYLKASNFLIRNRNEVNDQETVYVIVLPDDLVFYLREKDFSIFFNDLYLILEKENLDPKVFNSVRYYYSNWRNSH